jgi:hypothetical protein
LQFWYTEETAGHVARECVEAAGPSSRIACIACPSLFRQLRAHFPDANAHLFEVDLRFEVGVERTYKVLEISYSGQHMCRARKRMPIGAHKRALG